MGFTLRFIRCLSISQRYILKAIYNCSFRASKAPEVFINKSKIHFESYLQLVQDSGIVPGWCLSISQRYILKAIYNKEMNQLLRKLGVYQ